MPRVQRNTTSMAPNSQLLLIMRWRKFALVTVLVTMSAFAHYTHMSKLFEKTHKFSKLTPAEREMKFDGDTAFHYWFFRSIVEGEGVVSSVVDLMYNKVVEYPNEVNSFVRFHIFPEFFLGATYTKVMPTLNVSRECQTVQRRSDTEKICNGLGEPMVFYMQAMLLLAGVTMATIFLYGMYLGSSLFSGIGAALHYFANVFSATQMYANPNQREYIAQPILIIQMCLVTMQLRRKKGTRVSYTLQLTLSFINCLCLLVWQYSQYILLTQLSIFYLMYETFVIDTHTYTLLLHSHFIGLHMAIILQVGNNYLKNSLYAAVFLTLAVQTIIFSNQKPRIKRNTDIYAPILKVFIKIVVSIFATAVVKNALGLLTDRNDDAYLWSLLLFKLLNMFDFHSQISVCFSGYDFMRRLEFYRMIKTLLLPIAVLSIIYQIKSWFDGSRPKPVVIKKPKKNDSSDDESSTETDSSDEDKESEDYQSSVQKDDIVVKTLTEMNVDAAELYNIVQTVVFGVLALLVAKFKVLFVPQLCLACGPIMNFKRTHRGNFYRWIIRFLVIIGMVLIILFRTLPTRVPVIPQDPNKVALLNWFKYNTPPGTVVAATAPLSAAIMVAAAGVSLPNYGLGARDIQYTIYKVYGKFSTYDLYKELSEYKITHLVLEKKLCNIKSPPHCNLQKIWEREKKKLQTKVTICQALTKGQVEHYFNEYNNTDFIVFKIHDCSVKYAPRAMDT